jgi:hypothetical protein
MILITTKQFLKIFILYYNLLYIPIMFVNTHVPYEILKT